MKNIHILPTDKPSRLWMTKLGNLTRCHDIKPIKKALGNNVNIYITSDEEIKEGDWCLDEDGLKKCTAHAGAMNHYYQKIILTTDQDLIKDSVQAINDEFLEWFVKNPSCEEVEVQKWFDGVDFINYKIIIPKEEILPEQIWNEEKMEGVKKLIQKQKLIEIIKSDEELGLYEETVEQYYLSSIKNMLQFNNDALAIRFMEKYYHAKKEQERSYSEEEVLDLLFDFQLHRNDLENCVEAREWFEQFKKK